MFLRFNPENGLVPEACAKCVCATSAVAPRVRCKNLPRVSFPLGMHIHAWHDWCWPDTSVCELGKPLKGLGSEETIAQARLGVRRGCHPHPSRDMSRSHGEHCDQVGQALAPFCFGEGCVNAVGRNRKSYQCGCCL